MSNYFVKNAGKYRHKIQIKKVVETVDSAGFPATTETILCEPYAEIKTTKGFTLLKNNSDFEKALVRFTVRYDSRIVEAYDSDDRNLRVIFGDRIFTIEYLNNIDELNKELEIQAKGVTK